MEHRHIQNETTSRKAVFVPNASVLSSTDINTVSGNENCEDKGVWLELFCPEDSCLLEGERIKLVDFCEDTESKSDLWLKIFCPEGRCEITEYSQLP